MPPAPLLWLVDVTCFTIHSDLGRRDCQLWYPNRVNWHACCVHFGTLGNHRAIQGDFGAQERRPWGPGLDFFRFRVDFRMRFESNQQFLEQHMFFVMRFCRPRFLMIPGSASGCLGLHNQAFGVRCVAKNNVSHLLGFC